MTAAVSLPLRFRVGARTMFSVRRKLVRIGLSLDQAMAGQGIELPPLPPAADGYFLTSLPEGQLASLTERHGDMIALVRQRYARRYADLSGSFDDYLATFSGKSRSTLRRKVRKFAKLSGGDLDFRTYRTQDEMAEFHDLARRLSTKTYQEKLLDYGLPDDAEFVSDMMRAASRDQVRGWLLFADGKPVSYLYAPADGDTLVYAYLGYDPEWSRHSPGTVLLMEALRQIIDENRFRRFDFTEGDGEQKQRFATGKLDCADLLLLRKSFANRALVAALSGFDGIVALAKRLRPAS
ncbi:MAG: GNAT family N-acetyltransferase [Parasphingopyxis sp.]|uniref:GNAT family N-acetyltransferase n=1 Tax=Parasphingopyxis sp. TaxID=1920299 RepID=UPI003FA1244E